MGHDHEHEHDGHEHDGHEHRGGGPLPGALNGAGKVLFFDAFSGIAGDMAIAALLDLGVPLAVVEDAVGRLPISGFHLHVGHVHRSGIVATSFDVHVAGAQPERTYGAIDAMLEKATLSVGILQKARAIFRKLGEAEAHVHKMPLRDVHFHEVGGVDAVVDIVGVAAALDWIGAEVVASPLPMGRGFVRARHGTLPLPAPAVVDCLRGVPTYGVDLEAELVTPTGAAIVATVAKSFERWPSIAPERTGWGGGQRELPDRPNLLRVVLGSPTAPGDTSASHVVIEANVDDMTGELAAHALEALLGAGALDAWAVPITMKKGRPALTMSALAPSDLGSTVAAIMLRETSSIGVRLSPVARVTRPRRIIEVATPYGVIPVKVSEGPYGPAVMKPEFDACSRAAATAGVSVREVIAAALLRATIA
ncbi:MAG TPA: nickel pincer cofactor biosynthesis protein LarC [Polyangiaceae bacterium]|nr:nickel pincer cofactor biosynthesis protein LarC [Polyangiaceae bacterium]